MTYHRVCNQINTTDVTSGAGTAHLSGAPEFTPCFYWGSCYSIISFMCMFCRSLLVLLSFFFWPLCCLFFFDIQILITSLVSSNSSYHHWFFFTQEKRRMPLVDHKLPIFPEYLLHSGRHCIVCHSIIRFTDYDTFFGIIKLFIKKLQTDYY
jgi:hypothetical protein